MVHCVAKVSKNVNNSSIQNDNGHCKLTNIFTFYGDNFYLLLPPSLTFEPYRTSAIAIRAMVPA